MLGLTTLVALVALSTVYAAKPAMTDSYIITYEDAPNGGVSQTISVGAEPYNWYGVVDPAAPADFATKITFGTTGQTLATLAAMADGTGLIKPYTANNAIYATNNNAILTNGTTYSWYIYGIKQKSDVPTYNVARTNGQVKLDYTGAGYVTLLNAAAPYYFTLANFDIGKIAQLQIYTTGYPSITDKYKVIETTTKEQAAAAVVNIVGPIATISLAKIDGKTSVTFDARLGSGNSANIAFTAGGMVTAMSPGWAAEGEAFASMAVTNRTWVFTPSKEVLVDVAVNANPYVGADKLSIVLEGSNAATYDYAQKASETKKGQKANKITVYSVQSSPNTQFLVAIKSPASSLPILSVLMVVVARIFF